MDLSAAAVPLPTGEDFLLVDIERFQGPLDLLLHLIRQQDIDVFDIPIARITRQFLRAIEGIRPEDLDNAGEFLEMAATLVRIKARMLLPRPEEDEDEDPRAELVRRLLEYEQIREISSRLASAEAERSRQFGKGYVEPRSRPAAEEAPLETTWDEVWEAALGVEEPRRRPDPSHRVTTRAVAMDEKVELILETLRRVSRIEFSRLIRPWAERAHGVMTLLASLELGRRREVSLRQVRPFAELWLYRNGTPSGGAEAVDGPGDAAEPDAVDPGGDAVPDDPGKHLADAEPEEPEERA